MHCSVVSREVAGFVGDLSHDDSAIQAQNVFRASGYRASPPLGLWKGTVVSVGGLAKSFRGSEDLDSRRYIVHYLLKHDACNQIITPTLTEARR